MEKDREQECRLNLMQYMKEHQSIMMLSMLIMSINLSEKVRPLQGLAKLGNLLK